MMSISFRNFYRITAILLLIQLGAKWTSSVPAVVKTLRQDENGNDISCIVVSCPKGTESVPCTRDGTEDTCRRCEPDKYQVEDNVSSVYDWKCYPVECQPDSQIRKQNGEPSPSNPPICVCNRISGYYKTNDNPLLCAHKECKEHEQVTDNGTCVCKDGMVREKDLTCQWPHLNTNSHAAATVMTSPAPSNHTSALPNVTTYHTTDIKLIDDLKDRIGTSSTDPSNITSPVTPHGVSRDVIIALVVIGVSLIISIIFIGSVIIFYIKRRRRGESETSEEREHLQNGSHSDNQLPGPANVYNVSYNIINAESVQQGHGNTMISGMSSSAPTESST